MINKLEKEILKNLKNKKVKLNRINEFGTIIGINLNFDDKKKQIYIKDYVVKFDTQKVDRVKSIGMTLGKDFLPFDTIVTKLEINKDVLKSEEFYFNISRISISGNKYTDKKIETLEKKDVYGVVLMNSYNKKTSPNYLDTIFVSREKKFNDIKNVIEIPYDIVLNKEEIEKNLFKEPSQEEMSKRYLELLAEEEKLREQSQLTL